MYSYTSKKNPKKRKRVQTEDLEDELRFDKITKLFGGGDSIDTEKNRR